MHGVCQLVPPLALAVSMGLAGICSPAGSAALQQLRKWRQAGTATVPKRLNIVTYPHTMDAEVHFFVPFSSSEKATNFYLPLGMAFLFLGVLHPQV